MKVLNKSSRSKQLGCLCGALLEYTCKDIKTGAFDCTYLICPECDKKINLENENEYEKIITVENIEFPQDFSDPGEGINVEDEEINKWIKLFINNLERDEENCGMSREIFLGNTMIFVKKYEDEYCVWVTRSYYETSISR